MGSNNQESSFNAEGRAVMADEYKNYVQDLIDGKLHDDLENLYPGKSESERLVILRDMQAFKLLHMHDKFSPDVKKRLYKLMDIQKQHNDLVKKFYGERATLEAKYLKLYQPLYTKRFEIVNGDLEVEEVVEGDEVVEKGVPDFWLISLKNNETVAEVISERDEKALKFLEDIKLITLENRKGFKLEFHFVTGNPFFKNGVLTKTYNVRFKDEPVLINAIGTDIEWLPGKCLTQKLVKKKSKKGFKNIKPITKTVECASFFRFFSPAQVPYDHYDLDDVELLKNQIESDYDIGSAIRDEIIPHAVSWFTGEAAKD